jgi:hypothetical protein
MFTLIVKEGDEALSTKLPLMPSWIIRGADQAVCELNEARSSEVQYTMYLITFKRGRNTRIWQLSAPALGTKVEVACVYLRDGDKGARQWKIQVLFQERPNPSTHCLPKDKVVFINPTTPDKHKHQCLGEDIVGSEAELLTKLRKYTVMAFTAKSDYPLNPEQKIKVSNQKGTIGRFNPEEPVFFAAPIIEVKPFYCSRGLQFDIKVHLRDGRNRFAAGFFRRVRARIEGHPPEVGGWLILGRDGSIVSIGDKGFHKYYYFVTPAEMSDRTKPTVGEITVTDHGYDPNSVPDKKDFWLLDPVKRAKINPARIA